MASTTWTPAVRHVADGEPVSARVAGRPTRDLGGQTAYLKERLDAASLGEAAVRHGQPLAPGLPAGTPVYWDTALSRFAAAYLSWGPGRGGVLAPAASSVHLGLVLTKASDTLGDVFLSGCAALDLSAATSDGTSAGLYWLAGSAGVLWPYPSQSAPVCFADGSGNVYVFPPRHGSAEDHAHYRFALACEPAGDYTPPPAGDRHVITAADSSRRGWLPASHPLFAGLAPAGAAFGYNLGADVDLYRAWPPAPAESAALVWDRGLGEAGGVEAPLGPDGLAVVDRDGVWWMSDCYGDVPWPVNFSRDGASSAVPSSSLPECPRSEQMRLGLCFSRNTAASSRAFVSGLRARPGGGLVVAAPGGVAATTGFLEVFLAAEAAGAGSPLPAERVTFSSTVSQIYQGVPYDGMPAGVASSLTFLARVPGSGLTASPTVRLRLRLLSRSGGTLPPLTLSYRRLALPAPGSPESLPTSGSPLPIVTAAAVPVDGYARAESDAVAVAPGDHVLFALSRGASDGYGGEVGVLAVEAVLT